MAVVGGAVVGAGGAAVGAGALGVVGGALAVVVGALEDEPVDLGAGADGLGVAFEPPELPELDPAGADECEDAPAERLGAEAPLEPAPLVALLAGAAVEAIPACPLVVVTVA